ncbi:hypothetical protein G6F49_004630 [Rhizopus delemar]|nr:hypothetical protein G6F49_004630 [Rhizopus delemar]
MVAAISQLGLYMLVLSGQRSGTYKLATLMEHVIGRPGYHFLNFLVLIQAAGACVSYYIRALSKWSILSVLCLPVIIIALIWRAPTYAKSHDAPLNWQSPDIFGALGILAFAFACPHVCFSVYLSLKQQAIESWKMTTTLASIITWIISISFAAIGYLSFGVDVQPNLFLNFPPDDLVVNVARFALGFSMILTIPMAFHPTREAIQKLLGFETAERQPNKIEHYVVTLMLFIIITTLGITIRSLGKVYALIGGFAATCLAYILPSIAYLITRRQPYSTIPIIDNDLSDDEITNIKVPWMIHQDSSSSTSSSITLDPIPKFGLLDVAAIFTLLWGVIVMIFATSGALK